MALPMTIPSWLNVHPSDYVSAAASGLQTGLAAARIYQSAQEDAARLAQQQHQFDVESKVKSENSERNYLLEQQRDMVEREYHTQLVSQKQQQAQEVAQTAQAKAREGIAHYQQMQRLAELRNKALENRNQKLNPQAQVEDEALKSQVAALTRSLSTTRPKMRGDVQAQIDALVEKRKQLRVGTSPADTYREPDMSLPDEEFDTSDEPATQQTTSGARYSFTPR